MLVTNPFVVATVVVLLVMLDEGLVDVVVGTVVVICCVVDWSPLEAPLPPVANDWLTFFGALPLVAAPPVVAALATCCSGFCIEDEAVELAASLAAAVAIASR